MRRGALRLVLLGILVVGLAIGRDLWAAPGQNPARQTVPTRTPPPPPTEPPPPPTDPPPKAQPTPAATAVAEANVPSGGASEPLLPHAGGPSACLYLGTAMIAIGLLFLAVARQRA